VADLVSITFSDLGWSAQTEGVIDVDEDGNVMHEIGCSSATCPSFVEAMGCAIGLCEDMDIPDIYMSKSTVKLAVRDIARMVKKLAGE